MWGTDSLSYLKPATVRTSGLASPTKVRRSRCIRGQGAEFDISMGTKPGLYSGPDMVMYPSGEKALDASLFLDRIAVERLCPPCLSVRRGGIDSVFLNVVKALSASEIWTSVAYFLRK